ncbi:efflux RND transporter periplasmic adaptor subunit [Nitrosococcus oceani]|uniref:Secretion protein HlyD n=2 Tax=Nitrosococcus oceani TaxID=1229 RepID=Q3JEL5_NITOC|nr:efflux RND transporter periplasmic adaptor subunit [Nitrosococcus oceani]KFI20805.1 hemolysin D [Nitrosococcus oceani C-27]ABA56731.1 Secretion protein HlyD [Nitrosococcus oceani ATCC 19707]EDZ65837.1 auxiliary transport protein, MFP family, putative [Nitrosococcus oceani AFC27]KFI23899.1 hemolysin D [Nitrosococcus oceani]GEM20487.1 MexH family multidrug efflux RND transporter periplasmic adaptor subunit [Nitrosococcus oceani]
MLKRLIVVLLALGLFFGGIFGWKYHQQQQQAAQAAMPPPPATVAAAKARPESWRTSLHAVGSLVATQGVYVTNEIAGLIEAINFESGERIKKNKLLLQLEDSVDKAELEGLLAEQKLAELQFQRNARLLKKKMVSRSIYDESQAQLENAQAMVAAKRALIQKKQIRAPFSGLLGIRQVDLGEYLAPGSPIVLLQALDPIYVDYSLPERYFSLLAQGQTVLITVQAYPAQHFKGRITAINPGIDPNSRNVQVRATFDNPELHLRPGMFAEVRAVLPEKKQVLTVPQTAITYNPYGDMVFIIQKENGGLVVQQQPVRTGKVRQGQVEIIKGLQAGDWVVSAGQMKLHSGQQIRISEQEVLDGQVDGT